MPALNLANLWPLRPPLRRRKTRRKPPRRRVWPKWLAPTLRTSAAGLAVALVIGGPVWLWQTGIAAKAMDDAHGQFLTLTVRMGFAVDNVYLQGRSETSKRQVMSALGIKRGQPIWAFDPHRAKARLEALAWVQSASVIRQLPDTIRVRLTERRPMALWQQKSKLMLVDRFGVVIQRRGLKRFSYLPIIVGEDAPDHAEALIDILKTQPGIYHRVAAIVRVGQRRWNLRLDNGIDIQLPETGVRGALTRLVKANRRQQLLSRDVTMIDLRLPDRLVVRTAPGRKKKMVEKDT